MIEFSSATNTYITVGATSTSVLNINSIRRYALFINDSDEVIYLSLSDTAIMNQGIRLNANGGSYEIIKDNLYNGAISAICESGNKNLVVVEA